MFSSSVVIAVARNQLVIAAARAGNRPAARQYVRLRTRVKKNTARQTVVLPFRSPSPFVADEHRHRHQSTEALRYGNILPRRPSKSQGENSRALCVRRQRTGEHSLPGTIGKTARKS